LKKRGDIVTEGENTVTGLVSGLKERNSIVDVAEVEDTLTGLVSGLKERDDILTKVETTAEGLVSALDGLKEMRGDTVTDGGHCRRCVSGLSLGGLETGDDVVSEILPAVNSGVDVLVEYAEEALEAALGFEGTV
jgi:hypothetical protein